MHRKKLSLLAFGLLISASGLAPRRDGTGTQDPQPAARRAPTTLAANQGCAATACHDDLTKGQFVHGPVAVQQCIACHVQPQPLAHRFEPPAGGAKSCVRCHAMQLREHVHQPVADGNCTVCHDPHHSQSKALLRERDEKATCGQCHPQAQAQQKKFVHGPVAAGACTLCHNAHSAYYPKLMNKKGSEACLVCHTDLEQALRGSKHWHRPVSEDCALCHDAHASDHQFQLKQERKALCLGCHEAKKAEIASATVYHEALTTDAGCSNCHNTHASRFPKLLDKPVLELCVSCHDKPQQRPDGTVVKAIGKQLADSKYLHGPIREGDCSSCHNPHGSKNFRMLRHEYPQDFYAPFDLETYNLCFSCHDGRVFTEPKTETLTRFRNGDLNLHFVHVNKETKGRTCRACHDTHASNLPRHMMEKVPFGGWEIPINFEAVATGGACAPGCHKERAYDWAKALPDFDRRAREGR
jgi:predicted CXXCH cytochrome family protein